MHMQAWRISLGIAGALNGPSAEMLTEWTGSRSQGELLWQQAERDREANQREREARRGSS